MTWLLRKVDDLDPWLKLAEEEDVNRVATDPPLWAIRLFIPSQKDKGSLSLYEVADEAEAQLVAAAWGFNIGDIGKCGTKISFIAAKRCVIEGAGFRIENSLGGLHHALDSQHRGITPGSLDQVKKLTGIFIKGELFPFEGKTVQATAINEARCERFKFGLIAKLGSNNTAARNILKLVSEEVVVVNGVAA